MRAVVLFVLIAAMAVICCSNEPGPEHNASSERATVAVERPLAVDRAEPVSRVVLEIDRMAGTPELFVSQQIAGAEVSLAGIFREAGIQLEAVFDQDDIPRQDEVSLALLHRLMVENRRDDLDADAIHLYALVTTLDRDDDETLGIMFDFGDQDENDIPRESFAIFADAHEGLGLSVVEGMLLTAAHETGHCFNLHHADWEGTLFQRDSTIEGYSLADTVRWRLSSRSIDHLLNHDARMVFPGQNSLPFGVIAQAHLAEHSDWPKEQFQLLDAGGTTALTASISRSAVARQHRAPYREQPSSNVRAPLNLSLVGYKQAYQVGEPIDLTVELFNQSSSAVSVRPMLDPEYGFLNIGYRRQGQREWIPFQPIVRREARSTAPSTMAPNTALYGIARVFFGAGGWVFDQPGNYEVIADLSFDYERGRVHLQSEPIVLQLAAPASVEQRLAVQTLVPRDSQQSGREPGLYLLLQGGDHLDQGAAALRTLAETAPGTPQAAAANLAFARNALDPATIAGLSQTAPDRTDAAMIYLRQVNPEQVSPWALATVQDAVGDRLEKSGNMEAAAEYRDSAGRTQDRIRVRDVEGYKVQLQQRYNQRLERDGF